MMRYYLTQRPPMPGAFPARAGNKPVGLTEYCDGRRYVPEIQRMAWGYVEYKNPLSKEDVQDYELVERKDSTYSNDNEYIERREDRNGKQAQNS